MKESKLIKWVTSGGIIAAVTSSICCIGPLILGVLGVSGASSLLFLEDYRNIILAVVTILIIIGWIINYRLEQKECVDGTMCADPKKTMINIGATKDGIGEVYKLAKEMGFETSGVVSVMAKEYGGLSEFVDNPIYVDGDSWGGYVKNSKRLTPVSRAMVENSDHMIGIGSGAVGADELEAGRRMGKEVVFIEADMNHQKAILKAKKNGLRKPTNFKGDGSRKYFSSKRSKCNIFKVLNEMTKYSIVN
jgi:mercuric ion transport protein